MMDGLAVVMADGVPLPACLDEYTSTSLKFLLPWSVNSTTDTTFWVSHGKMHAGLL